MTNMNFTVGTKIEFKERVYKGKWPNATFSHNRIVRGVIINDKYLKNGKKHIFSIKVKGCSDRFYEKGRVLHKRGRHIYRNCLSFDYPKNHDELVEEKLKRKKSILNK